MSLVKSALTQKAKHVTMKFPHENASSPHHRAKFNQASIPCTFAKQLFNGTAGDCFSDTCGNI
jgi:hypothetical protein